MPSSEKICVINELVSSSGIPIDEVRARILAFSASVRGFSFIFIFASTVKLKIL